MVITVSDSAGIRCQAGEFSLLVDAPPKRKGNLILNTRVALPIDTFVADGTIFGPGEYEISGARVHGIGVPAESSAKEIKTIYGVELDGIKMAFLIDMASQLEDDSIDNIGEVDILFFSADSKKMKDKEIISLIKQIDPGIIIPATDEAAKMLVEEMGQKVKPEEKLTVKKGDFVKEDITNKLVWLKTE